MTWRYEINTQPPLMDGRIVQIVEMVTAEACETFKLRLLDTMEEQTRQALIALGWTPPDRK